jgi:hypothetical protein
MLRLCKEIKSSSSEQPRANVLQTVVVRGKVWVTAVCSLAQQKVMGQLRDVLGEAVV